MKRFLIAGSVLLLTIASCKHKKKIVDEEEIAPFFPVLSFLQSQVAHIDTSLYSIRKIIITDSIHSDTTWIKREEVKALAKDFLDLPDLTAKKIAAAYTQKRLYDAGLNRVILSYTPANPETEEVQLQEVLMTPDAANGDKVNSIIIDRGINTKDSSVQKRMLWKVLDQSFQVTTITQKAGLPEIIYTLKVIWE